MMEINLRATLDKGPRSRVQWNGAFLLVKRFKLVPRPLDKGPSPRRIKLWFSLHGIILEGTPIGPNQKNSLKESSWFGEPKCKLGSKASFPLVAQILWKWKTHLWIRTLLKAHQLSHFLIDLKVNMASFVDPCKVVDKKSAFLGFQVHKMKLKIEKTMNEKKKEKRPKVNLILSQVNHTFLILDLKLNPKPLDTLIIP